MIGIGTEFCSASADYERALMCSPLAAQLRVVDLRIQVMMDEQGALHPRDLVASALPSSRRPILNSA
jgi:hypothetical protein